MLESNWWSLERVLFKCKAWYDKQVGEYRTLKEDFFE
jgi:hypothetical protein